MPRTDVHQHLVPAPLVAALRARSERPRIVGRTLELREGSFPFDERAHDLEERLALLDREGVDVAVVSLAPTLETDDHPELRQAYHEGVEEAVAAAGGRLRALAAGECRPGYAGACVSAGTLVRGVAELADELAQAGQVLFVHPGPPERPAAGAPPWWTAVVDYTAQMQAAYFHWTAVRPRGPTDVPVVFAVLAGGAPFQLERAAARGAGASAEPPADVYLDTAGYGKRALELCLATHGADRLLYGSDTPVMDARPTLRALGDLDDDLLETVSVTNPTRLLA